MATVDKKYLDLEGLKTYNNKVKELIDKKVDKDPATEAHTLGAYRIATNKDGLVTETAALTYDTLPGAPNLNEEIGKGTVNGKEFTHYKIYKGSSQMDSKEFAILLDGVRSECEEVGIPTLTPSEIAQLKFIGGD